MTCPACDDTGWVDRGTRGVTECTCPAGDAPTLPARYDTDGLRSDHERYTC